MAEKKEERIVERILTLKHMLAARSEGPVEYHELGICYYMLSNFEQALEYLGLLQEKYPDYIEQGAVISLQILCLIESGRFADARALIEKRLPHAAYDTRLLNMYVFVLEKSGEVDRAIEVAEQILNLVPDDANARNSLGYLLSRRGTTQDLARAGQHLKKAISIKPTSAAYLDSLGVYLLRQKEYQAASTAFNRALKQDPGNTLILDHLRELARLESDSG